jgi:hypothetical protein
MDAELKKTLKAVTLELRHLLEGRYDGDGKWKPGDLGQRLAAIGVRRDRASVPVDELGHLTDEDRQARRVVDAYLKLREEAGVERTEAVAEFVRETAYTWANRLLALRCMEARELIDPVILQQEAYGGRSLEHHRLAQRHPELCAGDDDGLFAVLDKVFREQPERLPMLFDPQAPGIALRPAPAALKDCFGLLSLNSDSLRKRKDESDSPAHEICDSILKNNLFGIDIDPRAVQIAEVCLWMKAAERILRETGDYLSFILHPSSFQLVAATASHLKGETWEEFLAGFEREPSVARVLRKFAQTMEHIDEIGSLARPAEDVREIIRQEHATGERQVRERKEANYSFQEIRAEAISGQLPFHEISDDDFGDRLFYHARAGIDAFTERARESGEFEDQLLGSETRTGFRLVDLVSRRYDVVAANPPYMGSKNMGPELKKYVVRNFKAGKRDLYAAFILRNLELAEGGGRVVMVTQQSWMFLRSFADLRAVEPDKLADGNSRGLLRDGTIETLAHLGPNAFGEISGEVVNIVLFVVANADPPAEHHLTALRLIGPKSPQKKDRLLREALGTPALVGTMN